MVETHEYHISVITHSPRIILGIFYLTSTKVMGFIFQGQILEYLIIFKGVPSHKPCLQPNETADFSLNQHLGS